LCAQRHARPVQTLFLTMAGAGPAVIPRRLALDLAPGGGALRLAEVPALAPEWTASVGNAWEAALALTGRRDVEGLVRIAGPTALSGGSAGLPFGMLALAALLDRPLPPHFATGAVTTREGDLWGGLAAAPKAAAAAGFARQQGHGEALFLAPPLAAPPVVPGARIACATDLGAAFAILDPEGFAAIAKRHAALRAGGSAVGGSTAGGGWVSHHDGGRLLWRHPGDAGDEAALAAERALALRCAAPLTPA
jgi:hypothetical protein